MSEVLGYVLLFTLIAGLIGGVYIVGADELRERRGERRLENAERAFGILEANVDDIVYRGATRRSTTVAAAGSQVGFGDRVTFNLTLRDTGTSYSVAVQPVVYRGRTADVLYVNGAVIRAQRDGSAMLREPPMVFETGTVVPYIRTRPVGSRSVGGETTIRIQTSAAARSAYTRAPVPTDDYRVRLNVTTARTAVWRRYLTEEAGATCTTTGETLSCTFTTERLAISLVRIDVRLRT